MHLSLDRVLARVREILLLRCLLLVVALLAVACGDPSGAADPPGGRAGPSVERYDGTWELVEGRGPDGAIDISEKWRITLTIEGEQLGGVSACNHYGGKATIEADTISIGGFGGTQMACHRDAMVAEDRYHAALAGAETIRRDGDTLTLEGPETELVFAFLPPPPTAKLEDVRWELESLIHGHGPEATATSAQPAHLYFSSDGTFEGSTGCRAVTGDWSKAPDGVIFTYFAAGRGKCSQEMTEQNDAIINLGDGFRFDIEADTMTVYGRHSEIGLVYRAEPR